MGQMVDDVRFAIECRCPVEFYGRVGGIIPKPAEILEQLAKNGEGGITMAGVMERPKGLTEVTTHYCPGCTHGIIHRLVAEVLEGMDVLGQTVGVASVGCSVMAYDYFSCDMVQAPHGRAPAVATGLKRVLGKDSIIFTYQGDGDLAAIGTAETVHAATRGENITIIFVNNTIYGMTGGQMAPTTLPGQVTQTTPTGRHVEQAGFPIRMCEMLSTLDGVAYAERVSVHDVKHIY